MGIYVRLSILSESIREINGYVRGLVFDRVLEKLYQFFSEENGPKNSGMDGHGIWSLEQI
jgi:hypothetical protein